MPAHEFNVGNNYVGEVIYAPREKHLSCIVGKRTVLIAAVPHVVTLIRSQGREMMRADAGIGWTLLMAAASARTDVFEAVAKLLTIWLKDEVTLL